MADWYDNIENDKYYSDAATTETNNKSVVSDKISSYVKAMKSGNVSAMLTKNQNILKGAIVGTLIGIGVGAYTKKNIWLFGGIGLVSGSLYGYMPRHSKPKTETKKDEKDSTENKENNNNIKQ